MGYSKLVSINHILHNKFLFIISLLIIWPNSLRLEGVNARHEETRVQKIISQSNLPKRDGFQPSNQRKMSNFERKDSKTKMVYYGGPLVFKMDVFPIFYGPASFQSQLIQYYDAMVKNSSFFYGCMFLHSVYLN
jgi:hypothetical protein